jgi:hypothetical protein
LVPSEVHDVPRSEAVTVTLSVSQGAGAGFPHESTAPILEPTGHAFPCEPAHRGRL